MDARAVTEFLAHRGSRQLAYAEGWNAAVSVWEGVAGRALKVNGKADASDYGDMDTQIIAGLAPVAARPEPRAAFVVGYGSGVTARVLADVPGMQRVRVVELEPAVLEMDRFFQHVNDTALARPNVSVIVDDARSALQIDRTRYDIVVSEPSNPWLAGVATLYTPEFFRVVRSRLADDGVFCQWVQLYQLPLPVVAGIVRNVRAVFPHVQLWFGAPGDVMVLGSPRPLRYDRAWLSRLVGPGGALEVLGREYLGVDRPEDYFGHFLFGEAGVARLLERPAIVHRDDRPRLEFLAARRFIDRRGTEGVFDSLADIRAATQGLDGTSPLRFARALALRRGDPAGLRYLDAVRRLQPEEPFWTASTAAIMLGLGDTAFVDSTLARVLRSGESREALLLSGLVALRRGQETRARARLGGALFAGADTAETVAALALLDARARRWALAAAETRAALAAARGTLRHPYPRGWLGEALTLLALNGPAATADSLLAAAVAGRSGWDRIHELRGGARRHPRGAKAQQVEPDVLHRQHARLELVRDQLTPGQEIRECLALALEQGHLTIPFRIVPFARPSCQPGVALMLGRLDLLLEPGQGTPVHRPAHGVQGPGQLFRPIQKRVRRRDHVGQQLPFRFGETVHDPQNGLAVAAGLLDRLGVAAEFVGCGARQLDGPTPHGRELRLDRVGCRRPGEDVTPRVAGVPQAHVARHELPARPYAGDDERKARGVVPRGDIDDEQRAAHRGPSHEPAPQLTHDLGLAAGRERGSVAHPVEPPRPLIERPSPAPPG